MGKLFTETLARQEQRPEQKRDQAAKKSEDEDVGEYRHTDRASF